MASLLVFLIVSLWLATHAAALLRPPEFELNLDVAPEHRWDGAVSRVVRAHDGWENSFGGVWAVYGTAFAAVSALAPQIPAALESHIAATFPDHFGEIRGIARQFAEIGHPELNTTVLASLTYFYEIAHTSDLRRVLPASMYNACTGILSLPTDSRLDIIHGRNMDESPAQGRNCTLSINVTKGGALQYQMLDWMWMTSGVYTASRIGGVSLEMNWRNHGWTSLTMILDRILTTGAMPSVFAFRHIQEAGMEFEPSVKFLMTTPFAAPYYVITSGTQRRGAVLTLSFNTSQNYYTRLDDSSNEKFLVQCNMDVNGTNGPDVRRMAAEFVMRDVGRLRAGTQLGVWMALSTPPVHNPDTMFTVLMSVASPLEGYIRNPIVMPKL